MNTIFVVLLAFTPSANSQKIGNKLIKIDHFSNTNELNHLNQQKFERIIPIFAENWLYLFKQIINIYKVRESEFSLSGCNVTLEGKF